jgi:hypothetical protein
MSAAASVKKSRSRRETRDAQHRKAKGETLRTLRTALTGVRQMVVAVGVAANSPAWVWVGATSMAGDGGVCGLQLLRALSCWCRRAVRCSVPAMRAASPPGSGISTYSVLMCNTTC